MNKLEIKSRKSIIVLKFTLDWRFRCIFYICVIWIKGIKAALALKKLRNVYPETEHQLYKVTMALTVGYQAVIWFSGVSKIALFEFDQVQQPES